MDGLIGLIAFLIITPFLLIIIGGIMQAANNPATKVYGKRLLKAGLIILIIELSLVLIGFAVCSIALGS